MSVMLTTHSWAVRSYASRSCVVLANTSRPLRVSTSVPWSHLLATAFVPVSALALDGCYPKGFNGATHTSSAAARATLAVTTRGSSVYEFDVPRGTCSRWAVCGGSLFFGTAVGVACRGR